MAWIFAVLSAVAGGLATLTMLVMLMAGGANSSPAQITQIKWMMIGVALVGVIGLGGAVWAMIAGKPWLGAGLGIAPAVVVIAMIVVLVKLEW